MGIFWSDSSKTTFDGTFCAVGWWTFDLNDPDTVLIVFGGECRGVWCTGGQAGSGR